MESLPHALGPLPALHRDLPPEPVVGRKEWTCGPVRCEVLDSRPMRVVLSGRLDAAGAAALKQALQALFSASKGRLVIDLGGGLRLDARGLAALVEICELGRAQGIRISLSHLPERVRRRVFRAALHCLVELGDR